MIKQRGMFNLYSFLLIFFLFAGCNISNDAPSRTQDFGELSLKIRWENNRIEKLENDNSKFDCVSSGVETIDIIVYNSSGNEIHVEDALDCENHKGNIKDLSQGEINILLLAKDRNGDVRFRGVQDGIMITAGKSKKVSISASEFVPELLSPSEKSCADNPVLEWSVVKGAKSYQVLLSKNKNLEPIEVEYHTKETHYGLNNLEKNSLYYWRVFALDSQGNKSKGSDVFSFTTNNKTILRDINPGTSNSDPYNFVAIGGTTFFVAKTGNEGREIWITDGTGPRTKLLKDIGPGVMDGIGYWHNPFVEINGKLIFAANDGIHGDEIWISDGTTNGTVLLKDICPGKYSGGPTQFTKFKDHIYFQAHDGYTGRELWRTDGTEKGTELFKNIWLDNKNGMNSGRPEELTVLKLQTNTGIKESLFFRANDGIHGYELWKSDGTTQNTAILKDILPNGWGSPMSLTVVKNTLFFQASSESKGPVLWKSDGTPEGTNLLKSNFFDIYFFTTVEDTLFFVNYSNKWINELWKSDGTPAGTLLVKSFQNDELGKMISYNKQLYFSVQSEKTGSELWVSDGTTDNTKIVKGMNNGLIKGYIRELVVINGVLYFSTDDGEAGHELWRSDGTTNGTFLLADLWPGKNSGNPQRFTKIGLTNSYVFCANDGQHGNELWISENNNQFIGMLKDINKIKYDDPPTQLMRLKDSLFFTASDINNGYELWKSDGTENGTNSVTKIEKESGSNLKELTALNNILFFFTDSHKYKRFWKSSGNVGDTQLICDLKWEGDTYPSGLRALNNLIFFKWQDVTHGKELWVSDQTAKGTHSINLSPGSQDSNPDSLLSLGNKVYFTAEDSPNGRALWETDGKAGNSVILKSFSPNDPPIQDLVAMGDKTFFFFAQNGLWRYNIDKGSDVLVHAADGCKKLCSSKEQLFFVCDGTNGGSLWLSDGFSKSPIQLIPPIGQGKWLNLHDLIQTDTVVFLVLEEEEYIYDLWRTNGTESGTKVILKNIYGQKRFHPEKMVAVGDHLFFQSYELNTGHELWFLDGTSDNKQLIWDIWEGIESGTPRDLTTFNDALYFTASDEKTGGEIRSICLDSIDVKPTF